MSKDVGLHSLLRRDVPLLLPGVANALSALVAVDLGFEALYVTGAGVSNFSLGVPDIGLVTLEDLCRSTSTLRDVVDVPLVVDADTGFGNAVNTYYTMRRLEASGAAAIQLEDQVFPKKCGHFEGKAVIPVDEMLDKIGAAADARRSATTLIVARTDARASEGFEAAIDRSQTYKEAGADILFVEALVSEAEIRTASARLAGTPQIMNIVIGGKTPPLSIRELQQAGYKIVLYANAALQGAIAGMQRVLRTLLEEGDTDSVLQHIAPFTERQRLVRKPLYDELERRYTTRR